MATTTAYNTPAWWKESTIYQIYPASFKSTGSGNIPGWADIKGITSQLAYLQALGVDILWLSPIYKSPQVDMGYDISDYLAIDARYGNLADVDEVLAGLKARGMKLMMDLVVNHTSDQHAWFQASRASKASEKRDWYIWQPPRYDAKGERKPPNNWFSILDSAQSAWTWDEATGEYYLSLFTAAQPDLNWRNPAVRGAVHGILRFWLDRGVSGFRMDVINLISKVAGYPDAEVVDPDAEFQPGHKLYANGPHLHEYLREMRAEVLGKYDTVTVGEMPFVNSAAEILRVVAAERGELDMIFIFELVDIDRDASGVRWSARHWSVHNMRAIIARRQKILREGGGWNSVFIENHDNPRSVSRYTDDSTGESRVLGAKLLALLQTTLGGTLFVYQGEELGMRNFPLEWDVGEYKDVETLNYWRKMNALYPNDSTKLGEAREIMQRKARDHSRTPMQWNSSANAGFCAEGVKPWMRVNDDYETVNAEAQMKTSEDGEASVWQFWQRCLRRRKEIKEVFVYGTFELFENSQEVGSNQDNIIAYRVSSPKETFIVVLNFSREKVVWRFPEWVRQCEWVEGNYEGLSGMVFPEMVVRLRAWEGFLGKVVQKSGRWTHVGDQTLYWGW